MRLMNRIPWVLALLAPGVVPVAARPQASGMAYVRVHISDTAAAPLSGVDLVVVKNGREPVLLGQTDTSGRYTFRFEPDSARYRLTVRKLGYVQTVRLLPVAPRETLLVELSLARLPRALDTIKVAAEKLPLAKQPFIGADEIEKDTRMIVDLRDVVGKLRPDIGYQSYRCVANGNGRSAPVVPPLSRGGSSASGGRGGSRGRGGVSATAGPRPPVPPARIYVNGVWAFAGDPWASIHAEHIAEIRYVNCNDTSIPGLPERPWPSIYVVLKPGYIWDIKWGSHEDPAAPPPPTPRPPNVP